VALSNPAECHPTRASGAGTRCDGSINEGRCRAGLAGQRREAGVPFRSESSCGRGNSTENSCDLGGQDRATYLRRRRTTVDLDNVPTVWAARCGEGTTLAPIRTDVAAEPDEKWSSGLAFPEGG
jgi:hypothetical protein